MVLVGSLTYDTWHISVEEDYSDCWVLFINRLRINGGDSQFDVCFFLYVVLCQLGNDFDDIFCLVGDQRLQICNLC